MSKTVGLRDELYEKLEELATAQNVTVEQIIENLVREVEAAHLTSAIERMRTKGILAPREQAPVMQFKRIKATPGQPISEMIIEERR
jgi:predicted DNA-binding ribbon-helix-helix protein